MKTIIIVFVAVAVALLASAVILTAGWVAPPIHTVQGGFRGLAFGQLSTPKQETLLKAANTLPDPIDPAAPGGKKVKDLRKEGYENVGQVAILMSGEI